jgi:hypothetical protein
VSYKVSKHDYDKKYGTKYIFVSMTVPEAAELIVSLAQQIQSGNANSGRVEARYVDPASGEGGFFSIAVSDPETCAGCHLRVGNPDLGVKGVDLEAKRIGDLLFCGKCVPRTCSYCLMVGTHRDPECFGARKSKDRD